MEDLVALATSSAAFAAETGMVIVPAVPDSDYTPQVCIDPQTLDHDGFLSLASRLGNGVLYLQAAPPLDPAYPGQDTGEIPAELRACKGKVGSVALAFAAHGLVHSWERRTLWYDEWQEFSQNASSTLEDHTDGDFTDSDSPDRETRMQITNELTEQLLALPQFRAARTRERQYIAQEALPPDTDRVAIWDAVRNADDRAAALTKERYAEIRGQFDDLAAELLTTPEYRQVSSPRARKQVVEEFLTARADGFIPSAVDRDELYARAQQRAKTKPVSLF